MSWIICTINFAMIPTKLLKQQTTSLHHNSTSQNYQPEFRFVTKFDGETRSTCKVSVRKPLEK
jgi:hypothetical protein